MNTQTENIEIRRSNRKSISIQVRPDASVLVRAPQKMSRKDIEKFLEDHKDWIEAHVEKARQRARKAADTEKLSREDLKELADKARLYIPGRVAFYAAKMGVDYGRITIRNQKTRWGSCSEKGNLNFNCLLMLMPEEMIDYVVVHELAHRKEMNHSAAFRSIVEDVLPDYKEREKWFKENGPGYMAMTENGRE